MSELPIRIRLRPLDEPRLLFGGEQRHFDPKVALTRFGPFDVRKSESKRLTLGLVAPDEEIAPIIAWFDRLRNPMIDSANNALRFPNFPGAQRAMGCEYEIGVEWLRPLPDRDLKLAQQLAPAEKFDRLLALYSEVIGSLYGDNHPDVILVAFSEDVAELRVRNPRLSYAEERVLRLRQRDADNRQLDLFDGFAEKEKAAAAEHFPQADELLFRNFHRALKARCMASPNAVPLQIIRRHTYIQTESKQNDATRAWNLSVALYYKAGRIPWQPAELAPGTCFVGISFHHLKRRGGDIIYASLAQAYSTDTEPFALQGESLPDRQVREKQPYLLPSQAEDIIQRIVRQFHYRTGTHPTRVVIHKSSNYQPEEIEGFRSGCGANVASCDMVWLRPTGFRLIRRGQREVDRGIFAQLEDRKTYLFTTGYVEWWKEYPGPHIPSPLEIGVAGESDILERSKEILTLTKMNWNSADGLGRNPITLSFARQVGSVMTEVEDGQKINPLYRFYM